MAAPRTKIPIPAVRGAPAGRGQAARADRIEMTSQVTRKERALRTCDGSIPLGPTRKSLGTTIPFMAKRIAYWALAGMSLAAAAGCGSLPGLGLPGDKAQPLKPE